LDETFFSSSFRFLDETFRCRSSKGAWDILVKYYGGDPKVNKVKLQSLRRQYELLDGRK
jgi:hypothetical protein